MQISDNQYFERVFKNVRQKSNRLEDDQLMDQTVNVLIWGLFMSTTTKASVHLRSKYNANLVAYKNTTFGELKTLFDITQ